MLPPEEERVLALFRYDPEMRVIHRELRDEVWVEYLGRPGRGVLYPTIIVGVTAGSPAYRLAPIHRITDPDPVFIKFANDEEEITYGVPRSLVLTDSFRRPCRLRCLLLEIRPAEGVALIRVPGVEREYPWENPVHRVELGEVVRHPMEIERLITVA